MTNREIEAQNLSSEKCLDRDSNISSKAQMIAVALTETVVPDPLHFFSVSTFTDATCKSEPVSLIKTFSFSFYKNLVFKVVCV